MAFQSIYDKDGRCAIEGKWDPRVLISFFRTEDLCDRRVLDLGANTGGLSLELARQGAKVYAAEPRVDYSVSQELAMREGLRLTFGREELFDSHMLGHFDVVVCFGLLYHFRNPHFVLDYLSSLAAPTLYLSTQTVPGEELKLVNRARGILKEEKNIEKGTRGWQPTHPMLIRMMEASGFDHIESLTDQLYNIPQKPNGATNSAYYRAINVKPVGRPDKLNRTWEPRWVSSKS